MYIGATEVSLMLPAHVSIGTNTDPVTLGEVASIIVEIGGTLDMYAAGRGYQVPIPTAATVAYAAVQRIVKDGVGWKVLGVIFPNMGGPGDSSSIVGDYRKAYTDAIAALKDGSLILSGAPLDTGQTGRVRMRSYPLAFGADATLAASPMIPLAWEP